MITGVSLLILHLMQFSIVIKHLKSDSDKDKIYCLFTNIFLAICIFILLYY